MKIALDTNAYSDFRQFGKWKDVLAQATEILIPSIVLGELKYGFAKCNIQGVNLRKLRQFLETDRVSIATISEATTDAYAQLFLYLKNEGTPIPTNDVWIAAAALVHEATLCSRDRHFEGLPQIDVLFEES